MLTPLQPLAGLSLLQIQTPAPAQQPADTQSVFDTMWEKIAVGTGQVTQQEIDAAKPSSNQTTETPKTTSGIGDVIGGAVSGITGGIISPGTGNAILHPIDTATSLIFTSRLIFLVIGLLLVGAGLFQFKTTQTVIETGTKAVKKGAELFAA